MITLEPFDTRCNDLKRWLMEKEYNEKMVRKQISKARGYSRKDLFKKQKKNRNFKQKLTFNIMY